jgi:hypothetical protein
VVLCVSSLLLLAYTLLLSTLNAGWLAVCAGLIKGAADACSNIGVPFAVAVRSFLLLRLPRVAPCCWHSYGCLMFE